MKSVVGPRVAVPAPRGYQLHRPVRAWGRRQETWYRVRCNRNVRRRDRNAADSLHCRLGNAAWSEHGRTRLDVGKKRASLLHAANGCNWPPPSVATRPGWSATGRYLRWDRDRRRRHIRWWKPASGQEVLWLFGRYACGYYWDGDKLVGSNTNPEEGPGMSRPDRYGRCRFRFLRHHRPST